MSTLAQVLIAARDKKLLNDKHLEGLDLNNKNIVKELITKYMREIRLKHEAEEIEKRNQGAVLSVGKLNDEPRSQSQAFKRNEQQLMPKKFENQKLGASSNLAMNRSEMASDKGKTPYQGSALDSEDNFTTAAIHRANSKVNRQLLL